MEIVLESSLDPSMILIFKIQHGSVQDHVGSFLHLLKDIFHYFILLVCVCLGRLDLCHAITHQLELPLYAHSYHVHAFQ